MEITNTTATFGAIPAALRPVDGPSPFAPAIGAPSTKPAMKHGFEWVGTDRGDLPVDVRPALGRPLVQLG